MSTTTIKVMDTVKGAVRGLVTDLSRKDIIWLSSLTIAGVALNHFIYSTSSKYTCEEYEAAIVGLYHMTETGDVVNIHTSDEYLKVSALLETTSYRPHYLKQIASTQNMVLLIRILYKYRENISLWMCNGYRDDYIKHGSPFSIETVMVELIGHMSPHVKEEVPLYKLLQVRFLPYTLKMELIKIIIQRFNDNETKELEMFVECYMGSYIDFIVDNLEKSRNRVLFKQNKAPSQELIDEIRNFQFRIAKMLSEHDKRTNYTNTTPQIREFIRKHLDEETGKAVHPNANSYKQHWLYKFIADPLFIWNHTMGFASFFMNLETPAVFATRNFLDLFEFLGEKYTSLPSYYAYHLFDLVISLQLFYFIGKKSMWAFLLICGPDFANFRLTDNNKFSLAQRRSYTSNLFKINHNYINYI